MGVQDGHISRYTLCQPDGRGEGLGQLWGGALQVDGGSVGPHPACDWTRTHGEVGLSAGEFTRQVPQHVGQAGAETSGAVRRQRNPALPLPPRDRPLPQPPTPHPF